MSDKDELEAEVTEVIEDTLGKVLGAHGMMLQAFSGMAYFIDDEGQQKWVMFTPDEQLHATTLQISRFMTDWNAEVQRLNIHGMLIDIDDGE